MVYLGKIYTKQNLFSILGQCPFTGMETVSDVGNNSYNGRFFLSMISMWHAIRLLDVCIFNMLMTAMDKNINRALQPYNR